MTRAIVVKNLSDHLVLIRLNDGCLMTVDIPCHQVTVGTILVVDPDSSTCPIEIREERICSSRCRRKKTAVIVETDPARPSGLVDAENQRNAV